MRNYKKERENYHSKPEQMIRNAARKRARRQMEKEGKAKPFDGKDVHHKDNNPLNNDKKNLSVVTQHYNRKEPRIREKKLKVALRKEDAAAAANLKAKQAAEVDALKSKHEGEIEALKAKHEREGERQKKQDDAEAESEKARDAREEVKEGVDSDAMIDLMQKYLQSKNSKEKKTLLKQINRYQKKLGLKVTEEIGTVTGPNIAGTGDDSSTVKVKKKKKKKREEAMRGDRSATDWEKRGKLSRKVRKDFWKSFKKKKEQKESSDKRILDNVLAIQQKV